jgi:hypothetical protein
MKLKLFNIKIFLKRSNCIIEKLFLFSVSIFLINPNLSGQLIPTNIKSLENYTTSGENIKIITDRNVYCVNEKIHFTTNYYCIKELNITDWSNVMYLELIKWNGDKIVQMKLQLNKPVTIGCLNIPGNIPSGYYYLRAYTKWMRNFSINEYAYQLLKIVNPFVAETDVESSEQSTHFEILRIDTVPNFRKNYIDCKMNKYQFEPKEKVEVEFFIAKTEAPELDRYCISVVKAGSIDTIVQHYYEPKQESTINDSIDIEYLPELRGITISGKVIDNTTNFPLKNTLINLSELKNGEYFSSYCTNEKGRFVFSLPNLTGKYDFFIQTNPSLKLKSEILIDNDFCNKPVKLPYIAFNLNKNEQQTIKEMALNMQLNEKFYSKIDTLQDISINNNKLIPFYGNRKTTYYTNKYIELPNIEEFINEIILEAELVFEKGEATSMSMKREDYLYHPPLILMDNIEVDNNQQLLKIPLSKIEKVEVINQNYIINDLKYDGIISFYSKNKDYAGLHLNENGIFFTYELFTKDEDKIEDTNESENKRIPDLKNLLYWNPDFHMSLKSKSAISFTTSDSKGDYIVYIRGINFNNTSEIYGKYYFSVR